MNLLQSALNSMQGLIAPQRVTIERYTLANVGGFAKSTLESTIETYAHIQAITPAELKKYSDSTLDSAHCYKLYFTHKHADILHSAGLTLDNCKVFWGDKQLSLYAIRDWYILNGWVAIYATITQTKKGA